MYDSAHTPTWPAAPRRPARPAAPPTRHSADPPLASLDARRRETLLARAGPTPSGAYRFDTRDIRYIRLQGDEETVFLDFR